MRVFLLAFVLGLYSIVASGAEATSTRSFSNESRGAHPNTVTFSGGVITVDMSALPDGVQVHRAMLVHDRGGNRGRTPQSYHDLKVESDDAPGVWLETVAPRHYHLDCTEAVQRAVAANPKTLTLNMASFSNLGSSPYLRVDVWCNQPPISTIEPVAGINVRHQTGDTMIRFKEPSPLLTDPEPTCSEFKTLLDSIDATNVIRYRIYRHNTPIDAVAIRTAELVDEIKPLSGWDPYYYGAQWSGDHSTKVVPRLPIQDDVICAVDEGIYVRRADATGNAYYAVSRVVDGEEDLSSWTAGANTNAFAVAEGVGLGMALRRAVISGVTFQYVNNATLNYYVRWDAPPDFNTPSEPNHYLVAVPPTAADPRPVDVALHSWGGTLNSGYGWWYEAESGALLVSTNQKPYDWWIGSHANHGTIRPFPDDAVGNGGGRGSAFSQKRLLSFLDNHVADMWNIDEDRIHVTGVSMGGSGAIMWGARAADRFSYANGWVGIYIPRGSTTFMSSFEGVYGEDAWNCTFEDTGAQIFDYWDTAAFILADPGREVPYLCFANGKNDSAIGWNQARQTVNALQAARQPHKFRWGQSGHSQRSILPGANQNDRHIGVTIARNQTIPAFTNCSQDGNMGDGDPAVGDEAGDINRYLLWDPATSVDQDGRWEMTVWLINASPDESATVDITPRRCQAFAPGVGMVCTWENRNAGTDALIASGTVVTDSHGLVTLEGMTLGRQNVNSNRIIITYITAPVPPDIVSPLTASGSVGAAFTYTVVATGSQPITYGATGLPAWATFDGATATISGTPDAAGVHNIALSAENAHGTDEETLVLTVSPQPPGAFSLSLPTNGATGVAAQPALSWTASAGAATYAVVVSASADLSSPVVDVSGVAGTSYTLTAALDAGVTYHWRVTAHNDGGSTTCDASFSFSTIPDAPAAFGLLHPVDEAEDVDRQPMLTWGASDRASTYTLWLRAGDSDFEDGDRMVVDQPWAMSFAIASDLDCDTTYCWRVAAHNAGGSTGCTTDFSFTTGSAPLPQYTLTTSAGANGSIDPDHPTGALYDGDTVVDLTAMPETGYQVATWAGTDDDTSTALTNTVAMTADRTVSVTFEPIPVTQPGAFMLITPANGADGVPVLPTLTWNASANAETYLVIVSANPDLSHPVAEVSDIAGTSYSLGVSLDFGTPYYWRVEARNAAGSTVCDQDFQFRTVEAQAPLSSRSCAGGNGVTALVSLIPLALLRRRMFTGGA